MICANISPRTNCSVKFLLPTTMRPERLPQPKTGRRNRTTSRLHVICFARMFDEVLANRPSCLRPQTQRSQAALERAQSYVCREGEERCWNCSGEDYLVIDHADP